MPKEVVPTRIAPEVFAPTTPNAPMLYSALEGKTPARAFLAAGKAVVRTSYGFAFAQPGCSTSWLMDILRGQRPVYVVEPASDLAVDQVIDRVHFTGIEVGDCPTPPAGCQMRAIDATLLPGCQWEGQVLKACGSVANFLAHGLALCLYGEGQILSEAYALFWGGGQAELGAVTHPQYRGRGYAALTCAHLLREVRQRGFSPYWSCHRSNLASAALARRLGLCERGSYRLGLLTSTPFALPLP